MAPEYQLNSEINQQQTEIDKSDVWSLGIILFYFLFRKYPWSNSDNQKKQNKPPNLFDLNKQAEKERQEKQLLEKKLLDMDDMFQDMDICSSQPMSPTNNLDGSQIFDFDLNFNDSGNFQESFSFDESLSQNNNNSCKNKNDVTKKIVQKQYNFPEQLPEIKESSAQKSEENSNSCLENNNNIQQFHFSTKNQNLNNSKPGYFFNLKQSKEENNCNQNLQKSNVKQYQKICPNDTYIASHMSNTYNQSRVLDKAFILNNSNSDEKITNFKTNSNESQSTRNGESLKDTNILKQLDNSNNGQIQDFNEIFFSQSLGKRCSSKYNSFSSEPYKIENNNFINNNNNNQINKNNKFQNKNLSNNNFSKSQNHKNELSKVQSLAFL
ncbi:Protein kinase-like domain [Pseudocohnilembus persalinus]|uniref:Protein kinase-like domain n=1 Tax=Pseudocohnilembus persalinus TaxID=266149 RepID=A0A0V0QVZ7_PSEPJ|nr:Protein kinase-like domain [Pseudocohnilembus persalinus]|eukprot:KRX06423.1 Protein kinase-like domain [Pseudocohnilembus persalinus]